MRTSEAAIRKQDEHPMDEALGNINQIALALHATGQSNIAIMLATAHEKIQNYLVAMEPEVVTAPAADLYYIQNKGFCGNSLRWWGPKSSGYVSDLDSAGKYSKAEAESICRVRKGEDYMWPVATIDALAERHVTKIPGGLMPWVKDLG